MFISLTTSPHLTRAIEDLAGLALQGAYRHLPVRWYSILARHASTLLDL